jgi:hypothetical protein
MSRMVTHEDRITFTWVYITTMLLAVVMLSYNITGYFVCLSPLISDLYLCLLALFAAAPIVMPFWSSICSCLKKQTALEGGTGPRADQLIDLLVQDEMENTKESMPLIADSYSHESEWMHTVSHANQSTEIIGRNKPVAEVPPAVLGSQRNVVSSSSSQDDITIDRPAPVENPVKKPKRVLKKIGTHHFTVKDAWGPEDFWLLFFSFFCGIGSITFQANLSQVAEALEL